MLGPGVGYVWTLQTYQQLKHSGCWLPRAAQHVPELRAVPQTAPLHQRMWPSCPQLRSGTRVLVGWDPCSRAALQERQGLIHEQHLFTRVSTCKRLSANSFCHFVSWQPWIKAHCLAPSVLSCSEASAAHTTSTEPADSTSIGTASLAWMKAQTPGIKSWYVSPKTLPWKSALEVTSLSAWPLGLWSRKERFQSYTF